MKGKVLVFSWSKYPNALQIVLGLDKYRVTKEALIEVLNLKGDKKLDAIQALFDGFDDLEVKIMRDLFSSFKSDKENVLLEINVAIAVTIESLSEGSFKPTVQ